MLMGGVVAFPNSDFKMDTKRLRRKEIYIPAKAHFGSFFRPVHTIKKNAAHNSYLVVESVNSNLCMSVAPTLYIGFK